MSIEGIDSAFFTLKEDAVKAFHSDKKWPCFWLWSLRIRALKTQIRRLQSKSNYLVPGIINGDKSLIMKKIANRICCFLSINIPWMGVYRL